MAIEIGFAIGAAILFAALIYGVRSYQQRDPRNKPKTDAATRANYQRD